MEGVEVSRGLTELWPRWVSRHPTHEWALGSLHAPKRAGTSSVQRSLTKFTSSFAALQSPQRSYRSGCAHVRL